MFKNYFSQRRIGRDLDIFPSTVHNIIQRSKESGGSLMLTVSRSPVDFSGLGGIWNGPSHCEKVCCGQTNRYFRSFMEGMDAVCSGPKKKRTIQTVTSNKSQSQGLSWYGVVSVPLANVTYTSVIAPLMPKSA